MIELPEDVRLVLASASPRRADLLAIVGLDFAIRPADIDEAVRLGEDPIDYVRRLSIEKADAVERRDDELVLAADTTVEIDRRILGKPTDRDDARWMLGRLAGRTHRVHSAVTAIARGSRETLEVTTSVTFAELDASAIECYLDRGESMDKAGAYAIQGAGAALVSSIEGSASNVIGLPLAETLAMIGRIVPAQGAANDQTSRSTRR
ncbi:MAG: Maf family protein [Acidimicrobiia bacterium]|nr:Maf family protein [Acidimicrobiia bacterium]